MEKSANDTDAGTHLRWGILGTAKIAYEALIPAIRASRNGVLKAVASRDQGRALEFAERWRIPASNGTYEALLEDPGIDAVYIPLPNSEHLSWTLEAVRSGKHVLCEKPLGMNSAECQEMDAAAREHGVILMEGFMYRFHPRTERLLEQVRGGVVGELRVIRSAFSFLLGDRTTNIRMRPELGGGALMDVGSYCVNASRTVAGKEPVEVQALARWTEDGVDEDMAGTLRFDDGLVAQFDCSFTMPSRQFIEIAGTEGSLTVPWAFRPESAEAVIRERRGRNGGTDIIVPMDDEYRNMVEHFGDAVLAGRPLRYPATDAVANMRVIDALYRSARDGGRPCQVSEG
jgi:xylose dehydrogenase (NAD/NADP)